MTQGPVELLRRWSIGEISITKLVEVEFASPVTPASASAMVGASFAEIESIDWLAPTWTDADGRVGASIHSFLIETPDARLVVDTGIGNDKVRAAAMFNGMNTDFLERMVAAGWPPESVDGVVCTHLHVDHTGWNTRLVDGEWVPTFPNARYYFVRSEFEHWAAFAADPDAPLAYANDWARDMVDGSAVFTDSVEPVADAGLVDLVDPTATIVPGVRLEPSFGHTPGHVCVVIEAGGDTAVITGDSMHNVFQIAHPEWSSVLDSDADASRESRQKLVAGWADSGALVLGTHFGSPTGGRVSRHGSSYRID